jgi:hypothetical protein
MVGIKDRVATELSQVQGYLKDKMGTDEKSGARCHFRRPPRCHFRRLTVDVAAARARAGTRYGAGGGAHSLASRSCQAWFAPVTSGYSGAKVPSAITVWP